jgi:hypothetical protein
MIAAGFRDIDAAWWPFLYIAVAGVLANGVWRAAGVLVGGRLDEESPMLVLVRAVATGLVAGVIGNLVLYPAGALAVTSPFLRVGALAAGFGAWLALGRRMLIAIAVTEAILIAGIFLAQP